MRPVRITPVGQPGTSNFIGEGEPEASKGRVGDTYIDHSTGEGYTKTVDGWEQNFGPVFQAQVNAVAAAAAAANLQMIGAWSGIANGTQIALNKVVQHAGALWHCTQAHARAADKAPGEGSAYWGLAVSKGDAGDPGPQGESGFGLGVGVTRAGRDVYGRFTTVEHRRPDGTLMERSVLTGTAPNYATRTVTLFAEDGTTVLRTTVYAVTYNSYGEAIGEVAA